MVTTVKDVPLLAWHALHLHVLDVCEVLSFKPMELAQDAKETVDNVKLMPQQIAQVAKEDSISTQIQKNVLRTVQRTASNATVMVNAKFQLKVMR